MSSPGLIRDLETREGSVRDKSENWSDSQAYKVLEQLRLIPFDILVILFMGAVMLPVWAVLPLALINVGVWWCYHRIPYYLRTVSSQRGRDILIPGHIVENFARFIKSCGIHHRAHYGLMLAMMAGFHAAMTGVLWGNGIAAPLALTIAWSGYLALLAIDGAMLWVSLQTLRQLREDTLTDASTYTQDLERSNAELEQFAYVASHDLRSPLRAISNLADWIREDIGDEASDDTRQHLALMQQRVSRMDRLLNDLLQYSRIGRAEAEPELVDLADKAREIFDGLNSDGVAAVSITGNNPVILGYPVTYDMLLSNLIGNAIKHSDKSDPQVHVDLTQKSSVLTITVEDNGPGIEPEYRDKVFQVFQTLKRRDEVEASGMGLAIVRKIVTHKDGKIRLGDSELGGAKFVITLPVA